MITWMAEYNGPCMKKLDNFIGIKEKLANEVERFITKDEQLYQAFLSKSFDTTLLDTTNWEGKIEDLLKA